jgi:hypothetical protein
MPHMRRSQDVAAAVPGGGHLGVADVAALGADALGGLPGLPVHDGGVDGFGGPDPLLAGHRPGLALAGGLAGAAEDHVAGVFGVGQDRGHGGLAPSAGGGRRVGGGVGVEPGGDGGDAEPERDAPFVDLGDDGGAGRVQDQAAFGPALGGFGRGGVGDALGQVPVGGGADIPAGQRVFLEAFPGLFLQLQAEPFRDALLYPADEYGGGVDSLDGGRLVGGE